MKETSNMHFKIKIPEINRSNVNNRTSMVLVLKVVDGDFYHRVHTQEYYFNFSFWINSLNVKRIF